MARAKTAKNREQYYHSQMEALTACNLAAQAPRMGFSLDEEGRVPVRFFERDYLVDNQSVAPVDGRPVGLDHFSVIAHYMMSEGEGELSGEFLPISRLTGIVNTGVSPNDSLIAPLTEKFGDGYSLFAEAARKIGGVHEGAAPSGGQSWLFTPLPKLPVRIIFFEADEEFEAEVKVLFDSSSCRFVAYECLELLEMVLVAELLNAAGLLGCGGGCGDHGDCSGY
ncbi:hypothetical protein C4J81_02820 [Deltaproteobacteria bacterium Smac51]|nr:hypothetical protein C4J81_02820 [Deltaproteobacteria bacterium Smac51]